MVLINRERVFQLRALRANTKNHSSMRQAATDLVVNPSIFISFFVRLLQMCNRTKNCCESAKVAL